MAFSPDGKRVVAEDDRGEVYAWDAVTGQTIVPCTDPAPPSQRTALSPDGQRLARIEFDGRLVVQPRVLPPNDYFWQRQNDPARTHLWHLQLAREASQGKDAFALAFHLQPLLLTHFTRMESRPTADFPFWSWRPPMNFGFTKDDTIVVVSREEVKRLQEQLDRHLKESPQSWEGWASRAWCRFLLDDPANAIADLNQALQLRPKQPALWALLATVALHQDKPADADAALAKLTALPGVHPIVWHRREIEIANAVNAIKVAQWHRAHLPPAKTDPK
jgi:tetratricopeptide (TPR) repeat protein